MPRILDQLQYIKIVYCLLPTPHYFSYFYDVVNEVALNKLRHYCAYQERCHEEVRNKLLSLKIYGNSLEEIINKLIEDDFLNEERYAKAYAGGKFRIKKWGKNKIINELKKRKISEYCIKKGLSEIEADEYISTMNELIQSALKRYKSKNPFETKNKAAKFLISKGYESNLVWNRLEALNE